MNPVASVETAWLAIPKKAGNCSTGANHKVVSVRPGPPKAAITIAYDLCDRERESG